MYIILTGFRNKIGGHTFELSSASVHISLDALYKFGQLSQLKDWSTGCGIQKFKRKAVCTKQVLISELSLLFE